MADFEDAAVGAGLRDREAVVPTRQQVIVRALSRTQGTRAAAVKLLRSREAPSPEADEVLWDSVSLFLHRGVT